MKHLFTSSAVTGDRTETTQPLHLRTKKLWNRWLPGIEPRFLGSQLNDSITLLAPETPGHFHNVHCFMMSVAIRATPKYIFPIVEQLWQLFLHAKAQELSSSGRFHLDVFPSPHWPTYRFHPLLSSAVLGANSTEPPSQVKAITSTVETRIAVKSKVHCVPQHRFRQAVSFAGSADSCAF